jgi:hypothetical protein
MTDIERKPLKSTLKSTLNPQQGPFSELLTTYVGDGYYRLKKPFFYFAPDGTTVIVPEGFVTDGDSVPRVPLVYAAFKGRAVESAVVHDSLYYEQAGKTYADRTFLEAMKDEGLPFHWRWPIYMAVVVGGGGIYRDHVERMNNAN